MMIDRTCHNFSENEIVSFSPNGSYNEVIIFQPIRWPPYNIYEAINSGDGHVIHRMCGSMFAILKELAIKKNYGLQIIPEPERNSDFFASILDSTSQIFLLPMPPVNVGFLESLFRLSRSLGIMNRDYIVAAKFPKNKNIFDFFLAFEPQVWLLTGISLLILAIFYSCATGSLRNILNSVWYLLFPLLSEPLTKIPKNNLLRFLLMIWVLGAFIMITAFGGAMLKFMMRNVDYYQIDSWYDLFMSKSTKVLVIRLSSAHQYIVDKDSNDIITRDFFTRLDDNIVFEDVRSDLFVRELLERISTGCCAFIVEELEVIKYALDKCGYNLTNLHLSNEGFGNEPYFLPMNKVTATDDMVLMIDKLIIMSQESGLYSKWVSDIVDASGRLDMSLKQNTAFNYEQLNLKTLSGTFYIIVVSIIVSFLSASLELIFFYRDFKFITKKS